MDSRTAKKSRVCFYAVNAGALAVMSPVFDSCPSNIIACWAADGFARQELEKGGELPITLKELFNQHREAGNERVDLLILGSQHKFINTVEIIEECKIFDIRTAFLFDHWSPFSEHFISQDGSHVFPEHIFVIDEHHRQDLLKIGVKKETLATVGHPGIERKVGAIRRMSVARKNEIRTRLSLKSDNCVVLLALELMSHDFNADLEYGPARTLVQTISALTDKNLQLVVKLHPHQSKAKFAEYIKNHGLEGKLTVCPESLSDYEAIALADVVVGTNSTILMIPLIIGIPTICLGFTLDRRLRQITIPHLQSVRANTPDDLKNALASKVTEGFSPEINFPANSNARAWQAINACLPSFNR